MMLSLPFWSQKRCEIVVHYSSTKSPYAVPYTVVVVEKLVLFVTVTSAIHYIHYMRRLISYHESLPSFLS